MDSEDEHPNQSELVKPDFFTAFKDGLTYFMQKAKDSLEAVGEAPSDIIRFLRYPSAAVQPGPITYLGITYPSPTDIGFLDGEDFKFLQGLY
jgi:hypothetical protein